MREVEPLAEQPQPVHQRPPSSSAIAAGSKPAAAEPASRFEIFRHREQVEGLAPGVDPETLGRLYRGEVPVELRVDLHGLSLDAAREAVRDVLSRALTARYRCVLLVHGRGLRSPGGPRLKRELPGWLAEPPHGRRVAAFTTADPGRGGAGATLVALRPGGRRR